MVDIKLEWRVKCKRLHYIPSLNIITLPNDVRATEFDSVAFKRLVDSLTHEFLHAWLGKNINDKCSAELDNIDPDYLRQYYRITCG